MGERELTGALAGPAGTPLGRDFFDRPSEEVAPGLLGRVIVHGPVAVRLSEVEAYGGPGQDPASHTYRGRTPRNAVMFGEPGHLYVYFTYGMHFCANLVCMPEGTGSAVLIRAGEVVAGLDVARARRLPQAAGASRNGVSRSVDSGNGSSAGASPGGSAQGGSAGSSRGGPVRALPDRDLARGPARLAVALGLRREHNGLDCCSHGPLQVLKGEPVDPAVIRTGPRTGVSAGAETPWRFWINGDPTVSPHRVHVRRQRT
ncbi:DNA-3-methyladenine glycosylase [Microbispora sp. NPDC049125]|uniref:DNA-3-methyladenine glycosylase n=1 Tax=Microbispora sp. NPDC049125 TaxID=3154929 RepID=UPI00346748A0